MSRPDPARFSVMLGSRKAPGDQAALTMARSAVFGELVRLALTHLSAFYGDLYHDAKWLDTALTADECTFFYGVHQAGTVISHDLDTVSTHAESMWRIEIACPAGKMWRATFTAIATGHDMPPAGNSSARPGGNPDRRSP